MQEPPLQLLFSREEIAKEVRRLADEISLDYHDREVLMVGVLKGSLLFVADLARLISRPVLIDFVRLASYGSGTEPQAVELRKDLEMSIKGRDVLIVEDIIDSGHTLEFLYHRLLRREPRTLRVCTLIDKVGRRETEFKADYAGFTLDDGFIVGYGLDLDEKLRNLPDIHLVTKSPTGV
jgi:hypoxanthine phosphoribosyltransferase